MGLLYLSTLVIMLPLDLLFLAVLAKGFFKSNVGEMMLTDPNLGAAGLFYLLYVAGIVVFVSAHAPNWQHCLLFGAFFGLVCYGTFDLTTLAVLKGWKWNVALVDMTWGACITGISAALGLMLNQWLARLIS